MDNGQTYIPPPLAGDKKPFTTDITKSSLHISSNCGSEKIFYSQIDMIDQTAPLVQEPP